MGAVNIYAIAFLVFFILMLITAALAIIYGSKVRIPRYCSHCGNRLTRRVELGEFDTLAGVRIYRYSLVCSFHSESLFEIGTYIVLSHRRIKWLQKKGNFLRSDLKRVWSVKNI